MRNELHAAAQSQAGARPHRLEAEKTADTNNAVTHCASDVRQWARASVSRGVDTRNRTSKETVKHGETQLERSSATAESRARHCYLVACVLPRVSLCPLARSVWAMKNLAGISGSCRPPVIDREAAPAEQSRRLLHHQLLATRPPAAAAWPPVAAEASPTAARPAPSAHRERPRSASLWPPNPQPAAARAAALTRPDRAFVATASTSPAERAPLVAAATVASRPATRQS
jgi:hypothetical protein